MVWGLGLRTTMGSLRGDTTHWQPGADGSALFTMGDIPWAVDYSGASGAAAVIANAGGPAGREASSGQATAVARTHTLGDRTINLLILARGQIPESRVEGNHIRIGQQTIATDGEKIELGRFTPAR